MRWRWRAATDRKLSWPRSLRRAGSPTPAFRRGRETTSPSTSGSTADDVVGALDAFVGGGEKRVDLAEVNGRVFVNNVSLGVYAEAVRREGYREAKLKTILDTLPDVIGPQGDGLDLRWTGADGTEHSSGGAILVSNNRYRLGHAVGSGTRPRIDDGLLGIAIAADLTGPDGRPNRPERPLREWTTRTFEVRADGPVAAGVDGESLVLRPSASLRGPPARVASQDRPGASRGLAVDADARDAPRRHAGAGRDRLRVSPALIGRPNTAPPR